MKFSGRAKKEIKEEEKKKEHHRKEKTGKKKHALETRPKRR